MKAIRALFSRRGAASALSAALLALPASGASAVTITNGSLSGPIGIDTLLASWFGIAGSPDTNDIDNNIGGSSIFAVNPDPSPDGGTWVAITRNEVTDFTEAFAQFVAGFTVGATYELSWYVGNFGAGSLGGPNSSDDPNAVEVLLSDVSVGSGAVRPVGSGWFLQSITFVPTEANHQIAFRPLMESGHSYISIDGVSIAEVQPSVVPLRAPILFLASGFLALAAVKRKSRRAVRQVRRPLAPSRVNMEG